MSAILDPEFWFFVAATAGTYTVFGLGLQLQFGYAGLLNFGHVAFMAIGAYSMAILVVQVGLNLWVAALFALLVAVPFSLLLGLPTLRLRADYLAITTLAFSEIVRFVAINEEWLTGGSQGTINLAGVGVAASYDGEWLAFVETVRAGIEPVVGDLATRNSAMMLIVWTVALVAIVVVQYLVKSPWGRVLTAIREEEDATAALGKNVFRFKQQALAIGSVLGALAGLLHAFQFSFFSPADFLPLVTFFAWMVVILGGTGRNWGVPIGAVVFSVLFAGTRFLDFAPLSWLEPAERAYLRMIVIGLLLILLMLYRPQGIM
ncbi:MAG: branched-chain amino acid ABC transporter permease, partial [Acidimicrobiia bacterium]|nr:branched-chain amino acid ABC transporter permease [Acidimicrobiia bacterium]